MPIPDFTDIPTAAIADVMRAGGLPHRAISAELVPMAPSTKLSGPAFCVRGEIAFGFPNAANVLESRFDLYRRMEPGSVLLMGTGGYSEAAVFGENMALAAKARSCVGAVIEGAIRDRDALQKIDLPLYAKFATPVSAAGRWRIVELDEPLVIPGQTVAQILVNPGDWLVGDGDGIVAIPSEHVFDVARDAAIVVANERSIQPRFISGEDPEDIQKSRDRFGHVSRYKMGVFA